MEQGLFKKIAYNALKLATGKISGGVLSFLAILCSGRGLGTEEFGNLMLIYSYIYLAAGFGTLPCWQIIVHFGAPAYKHGDIDLTSKSVSFAYSLEILSTSIIVISSIALSYLAYLTGMFSRSDLIIPILLGCLFIPGRTMNASYGALRLVDKIYPVALEQAVTPALRALFCFLAMLLKAPFIYFVIGWGLPMVLGEFYLLCHCLYALSKTPVRINLAFNVVSLAKELPKGAWKLLASGTLTRLVDRVWGSVSPLIIARTSGATLGGLFALALHLVDACKAPAALLEQSYYPEISRANPKEHEPWLLTLKLCLLMGGIGLFITAFLCLGGKDIIVLFGKRYLEASELISWTAPSLVFVLSTLSLEAILFTSGKATSIVWTEYSAAIIYLLLLGVVSTLNNPFYDAVTYVIGQAILAFMMTVLTVYTYRHRDKILQPHEHH